MTIWVTDPQSLPLETVPPSTFDFPVIEPAPTTAPSTTTSSVPPLQPSSNTTTTTEPATTAPTENLFQILEAANPLFAQAITTAGQQGGFESGSLTVFAPSDASLRGLPGEIFTDPTLAEQFVNGHVVSGALDLATIQQQGELTTLGGQTLTFNNDTVTGEDGAGQITAPDQATTNGLVQGINGVLFVPDVTPPTEPAGTGPGTTTSTTVPPTQTNWELIQSDPQLSDYASAVATDPVLVDLINGNDLITVFAPTNSAVAQMPSWDAIVADPAALDNFVKSHAVPGALTIEQLFAGTTPRQLTTLSGEMLIVDPLQQTVNGARIVTPDTPATNGVVQTIDRLLVVPAADETDLGPPVVTGSGTIGPTTSGPECVFSEDDQLPIQRCDAGPAVAAAQSTLQTLHYGIGTVDCFFGDQTLYAVATFQADRDLPADGIVDEETWAALEESFLAGWGDDANGNGVLEPNEITLECG
jgi:uncharacterized surface protein with fasciclin (FAS1) repeats